MKAIIWMLLTIAIIATGCSQDFDIESLTLLQFNSDNQTVSSLFANDPCEPPCWYELTVNESNNDSVLAFIQSNPQNFQGWKLPSDVRNGVYTFYWTHYERPERQVPNNQIQVDDGIVTVLYIFPNTIVSLENVLLIYGMPDRIRFAPRLAHELFLTLIYDNLGLQITVRNQEGNCNLKNIVDGFYVDNVTYKDASMSLQRDQYLDHLLFVPENIWNNWITDGLDIDCLEIDTSQLISPTAIPTIESSE